MSTAWRLLLAVIVSSLSVAPIYLAVTALSGELDGIFVVPVLLVAPIIGLIGVVIVGLPVHFFLRSKNFSGCLYYSAPGFMAAAAWVAVSHPFGEDGLVWIAWQSIMMGLFGASVALVFRFIALGGKSN